MSEFTHGLVRTVSRSLARCELSHLPRAEFDLPRAREQHGRYVAALVNVGVSVQVLPELPDLPDATFVEDPVLLLDELAILGRPGVPSRQPEVEPMASAVEQLRPIHRIVEPGTLEGGDVLKVGRTLYVGQTQRTNAEGIRQLAAIVTAAGYRVITVPLQGCLHLKSAVTAPGDDLLLLNPAWVDGAGFRGYEILAVPTAEPWGANTLRTNGRVFVTANSPRTADLLESRGLAVTRLDVSELQKAEAGLSCMSVLFRQPSKV